MSDSYSQCDVAMVIPRSFSSGALSISATFFSFAKPLRLKTCKIAAVRVVLPWSTCPIVPTFTWDFVRSNLPAILIFVAKRYGFRKAKHIARYKITFYELYELINSVLSKPRLLYLFSGKHKNLLCLKTVHCLFYTINKTCQESLPYPPVHPRNVKNDIWQEKFETSVQLNNACASYS